MHVWCMYICPSILDPDTCIHVWCIHLLSVILTHVCMMDVFMMRHICHAWTNLDSDAYIHDACMHDAYTYAPWSLCICAWCINVWCIHPWSLILDYAACVYDAAEILFRTNEPTNKAILGVGWTNVDLDVCMFDAYILDPDTRGHDAYMYDAWCIHLYMILIHACMMYISLAFDPWPWCMYVWCIHLLSLILTHVCMMHVFMMRHICHTWTNLDPDAYIHYACMHDAYTYAPWSLCIY